MMDKALHDFLKQHQPQAELVEWWGGSQLRARSYLCDALPPLAFVSSARAVVLSKTHLLVAQNLDEHHILPGGRLKAGERVRQATRREVLEETGWQVGHLDYLGLLHYHHLRPQQPDFPYPYPDFVQVIFWARPLQRRPWDRLDDRYELGATMVPLDSIDQFKLPRTQLVFLHAALRGIHER